MTDTLTCPAGHEAAVPAYPMPREAGCPFHPPAPVRQLTAEKPISSVRIWDGSTPWLITRHADQRALLTDPRLSIDETRPGFPHMTRGRAAVAQATPSLITNTDAPEHTRLRRMVNLPFTVKRVEALRPGVQKIVDDLIDAMLAGPNPADLVTALGLPVPTLVISELLGVPYKDNAWFHRMSGVALSHSSSAEETAEASGALVGYLDGLVGRRWTIRPTTCCLRSPSGSPRAR